MKSNLWQSLSKSFGVFVTSLVHADYRKRVFVENVWAAVDKKVSSEEGKEFPFFPK